jgi:hypothetical protein
MDLSVLIPARNEIFLKNTIEDILKNMRGDTQVIAVLDGYWPDPPIMDNDRVVLIHHSSAVRALIGDAEFSIDNSRSSRRHPRTRRWGRCP